jgi:hypothetical protein
MIHQKSSKYIFFKEIHTKKSWEFVFDMIFRSVGPHLNNIKMFTILYTINIIKKKLHIYNFFLIKIVYVQQFEFKINVL